MPKILIVEDEKTIAVGLKRGLVAEGFEVIMAFDGEDGLYALQNESPDLAIVDLMMPLMNGFELTAEIRRLGINTPLIVLSARSESKDKVRALGLGADDYVTKPFDYDELLARIKRRLGASQCAKTEFGGFIYEWEKQSLFNVTSKSTVALNQRETKLLEFFLKRVDRPLTREQILNAVWGEDYEGTDRTVDNFVVMLRKKIGADHILTVRGGGYRFVTKP